MKKLIMLMMFFACTASVPQAKQPVLVMIKPVEEGFEIYSRSGELLLEFMAQDSADVMLLEYIHGAALDFEQHPEKWKDEAPKPHERNRSVNAAMLSH